MTLTGRAKQSGNPRSVGTGGMPDCEPWPSALLTCNGLATFFRLSFAKVVARLAH
jgi:hypothetical protein